MRERDAENVPHQADMSVTNSATAETVSASDDTTNVAITHFDDFRDSDRAASDDSRILRSSSICSSTRIVSDIGVTSYSNDCPIIECKSFMHILQAETAVVAAILAVLNALTLKSAGIGISLFAINVIVFAKCVCDLSK